MRSLLTMLALTPLVTGCKPLIEADPALADGLKQVLVDFDAPAEELAPLLRAIERQAYRTLDVGDRDEAKRAVAPSPITEADVAHYDERPPEPADPSNTTAVATAAVSACPVEEHAALTVMEDQRPVEPQSPDHYDRTWLDGKDCWVDRSCAWMHTFQDLTKVYTIVQPITYAFFKDFRWVDLNADRPDAPERWAYVARSWNPDTFASENGKNILWQSYTVEFWIPRDGLGFRWEDAELDEGEEPRVEDSDGGGTLRLLSLWTEADLGVSVSEEIEIGTIRWGMEQNYRAVEKFLGDDHDG